MNNKKELSIKSKLLFNSLDVHLKSVLNLTNSDNKRVKSLNVIFQTYKMTLNPFIKDESKEYQNQINSKIEKKYNLINDMIENRTTVETLNMYLSPILQHLKEMVSTCKVKLDYLDKLW